jgi:predicted house-cleaning noncanonical NTP pyrophosphatase (MazG superfamily)
MKNGKLVRDKIPDIIRANGEDPNVVILTDEEYCIAIDDKLIEEAIEVRGATSDREKIEELADLDELVDARLKTLGMTREDLANAKKEKAHKRGAFTAKYFLISDDE